MARTFKTATAFRQALEQRLKTTAEARGVPLNTLRLKLTIERLLARLFASADAPWLLKGGYAMELRYRPNARTTKDIDLTVPASQGPGHQRERMERIRDQLQAAADADLGDYFQFLIGAPQAELQGAPQGGARFPIEARLAGRLFGRFHVDVGVGDAVHGSPERLTGDDLLEFAGVAPARALAIPKAQQFAEKLHAYTFPWTDRTNTRTRDLVDMLIMLERAAADAATYRPPSKRRSGRGLRIRSLRYCRRHRNHGPPTFPRWRTKSASRRGISRTATSSCFSFGKRNDSMLVEIANGR